MEHQDSTEITHEYKEYLRKNALLFVALSLGLVVLAVYSMTAGIYKLPVSRVLGALFNSDDPQANILIWNIRLPRIASAVVAGWALGLSGLVIQCLLRNPLGSPFTLGISQGAAFGAAFAIVVLGAGGAAASSSQTGIVQTVSASGPMTIRNVYSVTFCAFMGGLLATAVILVLARIKKMAPEAIILSGVALSTLVVSGTILVQYFATEVEIASVVFWTFGDVGRSNWKEFAWMAVSTAAATVYFAFKRWDLNALSAGEDTATALGVEVQKIRLVGMFLTALISSLVTAFLGVIAFLGLLAPHISRRLVGADHRFLVPLSSIVGSLLLLGADTVGRTLVGSGTLPVGVLTSFMGAPLFLYLLIKGYEK
ncbi:MAG: iron complex transport system permease protein [Thermodesulfobacteriota bacterium]|nr:iron complex transport system permease protein [Thermodesulfobacteriota bacterium]